MNRDMLQPLLRPLIERDGVPVVFSHGDLLPKNLIFPGGLNHWRSSGVDLHHRLGVRWVDANFLGCIKGDVVRVRT